MRPVKIGTLTPLAASTTFFNAQSFTSTGAAVAPTTTSTTDGLANSSDFGRDYFYNPRDGWRQ